MEALKGEGNNKSSEGGRKMRGKYGGKYGRFQVFAWL